MHALTIETDQSLKWIEVPEGGRFKPGDAVCALLGGGGYAERAEVRPPSATGRSGRRGGVR